MTYDSEADQDEEPDQTVENMIQHLDETKQRDQSPMAEAREQSSGTSLQQTIQRRSDAAVLASNHEARLDEIAANDAVTHRSGKRWKSAKVGVESHGKLPIYYRLDGEITHKGFISRIVLDPDENTAAAEDFVQHITDDDTYSEYFDQLDTTTFVVTEGKRLDTPFPQSKLQKLTGSGTIDKDFSRQPAYVVQRSGDFPNFP